MTSGCYFCGSGVDIEEHHLVPQRFDGSDKDSNTVDLCHDCHWKLERLYNKEFWEAIGVEDPRATRESHIKCQVHGCMEQATGRHHVVAQTGSAWVYRCEEHAPDPEDDGRILETEHDEADEELEWLDQLEEKSQEGRSRGAAKQIEFVLNDFLGGGAVDQEKLHSTVAGGRVEEIRVLEKTVNDRVTAFRALTGRSRYAARYESEEDSWSAWLEGSRENVDE